MNYSRSLVLAALVAAAGASGQAAAAPQSTSGTASAEIVARELTLDQTHQLIFGLVKSINNGAGTVVIDAEAPAVTRSPFAGATTVGSGPCNSEWCEDETNPSNPDSASYWGPGVFIVSGTPGSRYQVVATTSTATAYWRTPANGREPALQVTDFTFRTSSSGYTSNTGTLDANGQDTVRVGGTLKVIAGMKTASYRVDVPLTTQFN